MPLPKDLFWHVRIQRAFKARRNGPQQFRGKRIVMLREPERYCQGEPLDLNLDAKNVMPKRHSLEQCPGLVSCDVSLRRKLTAWLPIRTLPWLESLLQTWLLRL